MAKVHVSLLTQAAPLCGVRERSEGARTVRERVRERSEEQSGTGGERMSLLVGDRFQTFSVRSLILDLDYP